MEEQDPVPVQTNSPLARKSKLILQAQVQRDSAEQPGCRKSEGLGAVNLGSRSAAPRKNSTCLKGRGDSLSSSKEQNKTQLSRWGKDNLFLEANRFHADS